jgi:hypothetical protein
MTSMQDLPRRSTIPAAMIMVVATTMILALNLTTTQQQEVYAQVESSGDVQDNSGDETITESNSNTNEITQSANVDCSGDNCEANVNQEADSRSPVTHGPVNTSRSNIKSL